MSQMVFPEVTFEDSPKRNQKLKNRLTDEQKKQIRKVLRGVKL